MSKSVQAYAGNVIVARELFKPVTIDGKWTYEDEWNEEGSTGLDDADPEYVHYLKSDGSGTTICKIKYDDEAIYWLFEVLTDFSVMGRSGPPGSDNCSIFLFKNGYNYWFKGEWKSPKEFYTRLAKKTGSMEGKYDVDHSLDNMFEIASSIAPSIYQPTPHAIYECKINREFLEGKKEIPMNIVTVETETSTQMYWPNFSNYGKLQLLDEIVVPEYPKNQYSNIAGLAVLATLGILARKLSSKDKITRREYLSTSLL